MLVALTTHPIQYQVPIWKSLAARGRIPFRTMFMSDHGLRPADDPGFGRRVAWDIDLLDGYESEFINTRRGAKLDTFWSLSLKAGFAGRLRSLGTTVLWVQGWQVAAYWQAVQAARSIGVEVWMRGETNARSSSGGLSGVAKRILLRQLFHRVDRFLWIGASNREFYLGQGVAPQKMAAAPYCVDNARFQSQATAARKDRVELRERWRIPGDAFCIAFVGKFVPKKRPFDLVRAAELLRRDLGGRAVHLLWVGSGEMGDDLRRVTSACYDAEGHTSFDAGAANAERVSASFAGFLNQTEISQAYAAADCLVLPSDSNETWGLVVNEAMASGLPCVVSDACGCADDLVTPLRPDLSYPVADITALAHALARVARNPPSGLELKAWIDAFDYLRTVATVEDLFVQVRTCAPASEGALAIT